MLWRRTRLVVLATTSTAMGAAAHSVGSGREVTALVADTPWPALAAVGVLSAVAIGVLGWQRRPGWVVAAALTGVQLVQHLAFLVAGSPRVSESPLAHRHGTGDAAVTVVAAASGQTVATHTAHPHNPLLMTTAHLAAAVLTAVLLGHGEQLLTLILTWVFWLAPVLAARPATVSRPARVWPQGTRPRLPRLLRTGGGGSRGPPAWSASAC